MLAIASSGSKAALEIGNMKILASNAGGREPPKTVNEAHAPSCPKTRNPHCRGSAAARAPPVKRGGGGEVCQDRSCKSGRAVLRRRTTAKWPAQRMRTQ